MVLLVIKPTAELITKRGPHTPDTEKKFLITDSKSNLAGKKIPFYTNSRYFQSQRIEQGNTNGGHRFMPQIVLGT